MTQPEQFEEEIKILENRIEKHQNKENIIAFYGSSSIRLWTAQSDDLAPLNTINLGFGGSQFSDCIHFFDRVFKNIEPSHIVLYIGENDLYKGKNPSHLLKSFQILEHKTHDSFPHSKLVFISIKPSPRKESFQHTVKTANNLLKTYIDEKDWVSWIDIYHPMLSKGAMPRPDIFLEDGLHMNTKGYKIWKKNINFFWRNMEIPRLAL